MLPLILAVVGGYFIGDSMKDKAIFSDGGDVQGGEIERRVVLQALSVELEYKLKGQYISIRRKSVYTYIFTGSKNISYNGEDFYVEFIAEIYDDTDEDGTSIYKNDKVLVDGNEIDLDLFTESEQDLIESQFDNMHEQVSNDNDD